MVLDSKVVFDTLRNWVVNIEYRNADGEKRKSRCTMKSSLLPDQTILEEYTGPSRIQVAYDITQDKWIAFDIDLVTRMEPEA